MLKMCIFLFLIHLLLLLVPSAVIFAVINVVTVAIVFDNIVNVNLTSIWFMFFI